MKLKKIIWAVNPFESYNEAQKKSGKFLSFLSEKWNAQIEPVYAATFPKRFSEKKYSVGDFCNMIESGIDMTLKDLGIKNLSPARVLVGNFDTINESVELLEKYAEKSQCDMVVVSTHARKGVPRLFLGSFAETLLLRSKLPVVTVSPSVEIAHPIKNILFATNFEKSSTAVFKEVVALAEKWKAKITVLHVFEPIMQIPIQDSFSNALTLVPSKQEMLEIEKESLEKATRFVEKMNAQHIVSNISVVERGETIASTIVDFTKKHKMDLVALAAQGTTIGTILFGSTVRQLVRSSICPVWAMKE